LIRLLKLMKFVHILKAQKMAKRKSKDKHEPSTGSELNNLKITVEIPIKCSYEALIPLSELIPTQGKLKVSKGENLLKLEKSFEKHGFIEPIVLWWDLSDGKKGKGTTKILGGHQRRKVLFKMAKNGKGTKDLLIPVIYSHADSFEQAMEILLQLIGSTGEVNQEGLIAFAKEHSFSLDEIGAKISLGGVSTLANAKKALEQQAVEKIQENPKFPIQAHFVEKYGSITIFYKNEMDEIWLKNLLKLGKVQDFNSNTVGPCHVVDVTHVQDIIEEMEISLRPSKEDVLLKDASIEQLSSMMKELESQIKAGKDDKK